MATPEIRSLAENPMYLGLLCEHMKSGRPFPLNAYNIFEGRNTVAAIKIARFHPSRVRVAAENIAFCMAADAGLASVQRGSD